MAMVDAEAIVKELRETYASGKTKNYEWRVSQLKALLKIAEHHEKEIVDALNSDLSKPELESFVHEISMMKTSCKHALKELKRWMKPEKVKTSLTTFPSSAEIVPEPLGVVLVISAWNYPFLLSLDPVIGAIAAGNAVVLKPSEIAPATSSVLAKLLGEYMDVTAVRVVEGAIPETTALLEQKWDKIFYTGNGKVGRIVMTAAAKHLTPVVLELGGKSPAVVDSNINLKVAVRRIIAGKWGCNNGQACISPDYIITTKENVPKLLDAMKFELEKFYGKDPLKSGDLSRIVNANHFHRLSKLLDENKVVDKVVHGGQRDENNLKIAPTILLDVPEDALIMKEEIFGPLLPILTVNKVEDSIHFINAREKPLAAYLFTSNKKLEEEFVRNISAGGLLINDTTLHLAISSLPFGGVGESGMGSYHGRFSFEAFSHKKAVLRRSFGGDVPARYPPYTPEKVRFLKALLNGNILGLIRALLGW
ncbi:PREDICTED: aldehyde dehydrogenase [Nicotiana attenuata]|uniref:Aldehyde dehydrogenase n=1 Tax=Nicotiana attenuata TaxID=49451 RepID=A0A1J6IDB6_NICAT|nr:PREDICTED: aldehyde dehydrogenase [Nicotiana attenuata]OIT02388.1 aldehyde dehydrogenase family 3 member h1 [Nicotiana attenuata]